MNLKIIIPIFFFFTISKSFSQSLNLSDLAYLYSHRTDEADTYISKKGYEFKHHKENDGTCSETGWSFERNRTDISRAKAFLNKYCDEANYGFIWFQPFDKINFENIKSDCIKNGFKFISQEYSTSVGALSFIYRNKEYQIEFSSGLLNNENVYSITYKKI